MLVVCLALLAGICAKDFLIKKPKSKPALGETELAEVQAEQEPAGMVRAEAFRLISYLYYTEEERVNLSCEREFQDVGSGEWYDEFVKAVYNAGFENQADSVNEKYYMRPEADLVWHEAKRMFEKIAETAGVSLADITQKAGIAIDAMEPAKVVSREAFLQLYEAAVASMSGGKQKVKKEMLYLLAVEDDGSLITQKGRYQGGEVFYIRGEEMSATKSLRNCVDCCLEVMVSEKRILYVRDESAEETQLSNVYLIHGEGTTLTAYVEGLTKEFQLKAPLTSTIDGMVANLRCAYGLVVGISIMPDMVSDKVLAANDHEIELEHYGIVEFAPDFRIYKVYGEIAMEQANAILVGYENTKFVLTDHKISAALITEPVTAENIRVMIRSTGYQGLFHEQVKVTCKKEFTVQYADQSKTFDAQSELTIKPNSKYLKEGRVRITGKDEAPIQILSIERNQGNPKYRGSIEINNTSEGMTIINELPIEEYLYAVLPSEMPASYGKEALKTQAVCARSYAYKQLVSNGLRSYGAHIDDSSEYQVYNNYPETKETMEAVKETYGQVIAYEGDVITAYYFSTSCGHTSSMTDVWGGSQENAYLIGSFQTAQEPSKGKKYLGETVETMSTNLTPDFSDETAFRTFIKDKNYPALEEKFAWYRWKTSLSYEQIEKNIDKKIAGRYLANPTLVLTEKVSEDGKVSFVSEPISTIGKVTGLEVKERKSSGIVTELIIHGTKATVLVRTEYNIRSLLAPGSAKVVRQDKSEVKQLSLLPSAFFVLDETDEGVKVTGGGYGHGVGMSQNGVKALSDLGYSYDQIVAYYYKGTELKNMYQ